MNVAKDTMRGNPQPLVLMWKSAWLPTSETFISSQIESLKGWSSISVGSQVLDSSLATGNERILFGTSRRENVARRLFELTGRSSRLEQAIVDCKPEVIHAHFAHEGFLVRRAARRSGIPLVVSLYGSDVSALPARRGVKGLFFRRRLRETFATADVLLAISASIAQQAIRYGAPREKVVVHRVGMDVGLPSQGDSGDRTGILFIGRMVPKKGLDHLIKAIASLEGTLSSIPVTVIGDGPLLDEMRAQAHAKQLNFTFVGYQNTTEVLSAMRSHSLLCVPSITAVNGDAEGLPTVLVQAGGCGLPTVAYAHGGIPEIIADGINGLLVPEGDIGKLAAALETALTDTELRRAMGSSAVDVVAAGFSPGTQSAKLERIYEVASTGRRLKRHDPFGSILGRVRRPQK